MRQSKKIKADYWASNDAPDPKCSLSRAPFEAYQRPRPGKITFRYPKHRPVCAVALRLALHAPLMPNAPAPGPSPESDASSPDRIRTVAKYSGIAFQMLATIGLSAWAGVWLDGHFHSKTPWFTIGLMLAGVLVALYQVIRSLTKGV